MTRIAAVTMTYNEPDMLPLWLRHYAAHDRYVIDHGSTDGSTANLPCERIRLPPSKHDNRARADFVTDFTRQLLHKHDAILFTDVDELVSADPAGKPLEAIVEMMKVPVLTAIGLNVLHKMHEEGPLDPARGILAQRHYVSPTASMCKPILFREPVEWSPGFHCSNHPVRIGRFFVWHMAYADRTIARRRQTKRRGVEGASAHHRVDEDTVTRWLEGWSTMPVVKPTMIPQQCQVLDRFLRAVLASQLGRERKAYKLDLAIGMQELWRVPERFWGVV